jgi:phage shock protein PspC (stress-responsive transcriptional regulator)
MNDLTSDFKKLRRVRQGRLVGGLCAGIARQYGVEVLLVRAVFVIAATVVEFGFLVYLLGLVLVQADPHQLTPTASRVRIRRNKRELLGFGLLGAAINGLAGDSLSNNRLLAVTLIVGGLVIMRARNNHLQSAPAAGAPSPPPPGGWTSEGASPPPPRWGLAGDVINPQTWGGAPYSAGSPTGDGTGAGTGAGTGTSAATQGKSIWQNQFGNVALVVLVSVLAVGLWSNTSRLSPVRKATVRDRFASEPWVLRTDDGVEELADTQLDNGAFVIDATDLKDPERPVRIRMGSGRLELVVSDNATLTGTVKSRSGALTVRHFGGVSSAPVTLRPSTQASSWKTSNPITVDITADVGFVCIRTASDTKGCLGQLAAPRKAVSSASPTPTAPTTPTAPPTPKE